MRRAFLPCLVLVLWATALAAQPPSPATAGWEPWQPLVGDWIGEGGGAPGQGGGTFSFHFDLGEKVLVRRSVSDYPASNGRPAVHHEDLMVIHPGDPGKMAADYFDNEGHVIRYAATWSDDRATVTFLSEAAAGTPRFRLTYQRTGPDALAIRFEIAPPGKPDAFSTYAEGTARRAAKP